MIPININPVAGKICAGILIGSGLMAIHKYNTPYGNLFSSAAQLGSVEAWRDIMISLKKACTNHQITVDTLAKDMQKIADGEKVENTAFSLSPQTISDTYLTASGINPRMVSLLKDIVNA